MHPLDKYLIVKTYLQSNTTLPFGNLVSVQVPRDCKADISSSIAATQLGCVSASS